MDLEGFENAPEAAVQVKFSRIRSCKETLVLLDRFWFVQATRSSRWMDLLGDYAGSEPFVIDGEALFQIILDDPLLSIGRTDCSFQILHAYHSLETILSNFQSRYANFEIVFWDQTRHVAIQTGQSDFAFASRALARSMLFRHLFKLPFSIHVFESLDDPLWLKYVLANKPMFIMTNDGGLAHGATNNIKTAVVFAQRIFLLSILSHGLPVSLLRGAEYRDSKILSFVFEPKIGTHKILEALEPNILAVNKALLEPPSKLSGIYLDLHLRLSPESVNNNTEDRVIDFFRNLDILSSIQAGMAPEIVYLFIVHSLFLPFLRIGERSQFARTLAPQLIDSLPTQFLSPLFLKAAAILASQDHPFQVDGTVFIALIAFFQSHSPSPSTAIELEIYQESQRIWRALNGPSLDFSQFSEHAHSVPDLVENIQYTIIKPYWLLPFSHPTFEDKFSIFQRSTDPLEHDPVSQNFQKSIRFRDDKHWHNQKSILPSHQGGSHSQPTDAWTIRSRLRSTQRYMAIMQVQAASLTGASGAILKQIVIPPVGTSSKAAAQENRKVAYHGNKKNKAPTLSSADKLRLKIKEEKQAGSQSISQTRWAEQVAKMATMTLSEKIELTTIFSRNPKIEAPEIRLEIHLFRLALEMQKWIDEADRESPLVRDRYTVSIMRMVKDMVDFPIITRPIKEALSTVLAVLGFGYSIPALLSNPNDNETRLHFRFIKLIDSKTKTPLYRFMTITEHHTIWQLRLFGEFMDRSMDSQPDRRVAFEPDAWQRNVLDGIDQSKSLLVVAPTSAGKTFISYYAMEQVLKQSDDGILIYIAPTKALVTQIAAEVYARFRKDLKGKSCWAVHTREYRINDPQNCQILITVPEVLTIMLLSPPLAKVWTPRIKRIVLDEIHSIGQQERGAVWEQIILFAPCPIIGLSATIGSPERFSEWLASVQHAHGFDYAFIEHRRRYSHLRKFFYLIDGRGTVKSLDKHQATGRSRFLHPIALLLFGARGIPTDLSLEASDTLTLFNSLYSVKSGISADLEDLKPEHFFASSSGLLRQKDVLQYESRLKSILTDLLESSDPRDLTTPLGGVVRSLQDPIIEKMGEKLENMVPSREAFKNDLLVLLADLHTTKDLPAILFSFDRSDCEIMAQHLVEELEHLETKWRSDSPEWKRRLKQVEAWNIRAAALKRAAEKLKKTSKRNDDDIRDAPEASWESTFDPDEPSPQFSFANYRADYSKSDLEKAIQKLQWVPKWAPRRGTTPKWLFDALRRGIAVHHAGMQKQYRTLVESLFRLGFVRVMIATGTLALGINAPTRTTVFCGDSPFLTALMYRQCAGRAGRRGFDLSGNVVFYGLSLDRVRRLTLSRLPILGGTFPLTSTMTLRLFNLLDGSNDAEVAVRGIQSLLSLPQITTNSNFGHDQLLHHLRFSIEFLRRSRLLDENGKPINLFGIAARLYYTEPSNFALVKLMESGVLHTILSQSGMDTAKKQFMIIMANLFGRRYLSKVFANEDNIKRLTESFPSMVVLPPLPEAARTALVEYDREILDIFSGYASAFTKASASHIGPDDTLPLSGIRIGGRTSCTQTPSLFHAHLQKTCIPVIVRSPFVANSGHGDNFESIAELTTTARSGLNLNAHAIPSMSHLTYDFEADDGSLEHRLNAYILDFYIHGQVAALSEANCIRRGDVWYLLQDFNLTLLTVKAALEQILSKAPNSEGADIDLNDQNPEYDEEDVEELDRDNSETLVDDNHGEGRKTRPGDISVAEDMVYRVVCEVCAEFETKFKAMWA